VVRQRHQGDGGGRHDDFHRLFVAHPSAPQAEAVFGDAEAVPRVAETVLMRRRQRDLAGLSSVEDAKNEYDILSSTEVIADGIDSPSYSLDGDDVLTPETLTAQNVSPYAVVDVAA